MYCTVWGQQVRELETELEAEQHRHVDTQKAVRKQDRRLQELILQLDEGQKSQDRLKDMIDKLQQKNKQYKRQVEEAVSAFRTYFVLFTTARCPFLLIFSGSKQVLWRLCQSNFCKSFTRDVTIARIENILLRD